MSDGGYNPDTFAAEEAVDDKSLLDKIIARREERDDEPEKFDIPGWGGELKAQYRVVEREEIEKAVRRVRARQSGRRDADPLAGVNSDLDFLINACVGVWAYDIENDEEELLTNGFNPQLTGMLGQTDKIKSARELVLYLFSEKDAATGEKKPNTIALAAHGQKVARWMQDTSKPVGDPQ